MADFSKTYTRDLRRLRKKYLSSIVQSSLSKTPDNALIEMYQGRIKEIDTELNRRESPAK